MTKATYRRRKKIYLACPYSTEDESLKTQRVVAATTLAAELSKNGDTVFSPLTHSHPMSLMGDLPQDWEFWEKIDRDFLEMCDELYVLAIDGWEESVGVTSELGMAQEMKMPIKILPAKLSGCELIFEDYSYAASCNKHE